MTLPSLSRKLLCATALLVCTLPIHAGDWGFGKRVTGSGVIVTETRQVSGFSGIGLSTPADVEIRQGNSEGLTITGDDNIVPLVETVVEEGSLKVRWKEKNINTSYKQLKITIDAKTVEKLAVGGSGNVHAASLKTPRLKVSIGGSADVTVQSLACDELEGSIAGSGTLSAGGKTKTMRLSVSGSGDIKMPRLEAEDVKISVAGSGDATVWATGKLSVSVAGSGDVRYYGNAEVSQSVAGSGSIKKLGSAP